MDVCAKIFIYVFMFILCKLLMIHVASISVCMCFSLLTGKMKVYDRIPMVALWPSQRCETILFCAFIHIISFLTCTYEACHMLMMFMNYHR